MTTNPEVPRFHPAALVEVREARGLTQRDLARMLRVHSNLIHRWERGKTDIKAVDLRRAAYLLRVVLARLQHPLPADPTLADLRTRLALTVEETAARLAVKPSRLATWETGVLGGPGEHGALLAAIIGVDVLQIAAYEQTGALPRSLARRLSAVLRVDTDVVQDAFAASRHRHLATAAC